MDTQVLYDYSVKRYRSAKSTPNSSQQSPMRKKDELHTQNGLTPKKTLRHTSFVEASNRNAEESSKIKTTDFQLFLHRTMEASCDGLGATRFRS